MGKSWEKEWAAISNELNCCPTCRKTLEEHDDVVCRALIEQIKKENVYRQELQKLWIAIDTFRKFNLTTLASALKKYDAVVVELKNLQEKG